MGSDTQQRILRAKYLDWCSAKIAERFLALSPDEIYELAERASHGATTAPDPAGSFPSSASASSPDPDWRAALDQTITAVVDDSTEESVPFRALIARVTEVLADELELPTLEEWSAAYSEAPEEFDPDMLGFWREAVE